MGNRRETKSTHKRKKVDGRKRILTTAIVTLVAIVAVFGIWELGRYYRKWGAPDELRAIMAESLTKEDVLIPGMTEVDTRISGMGSFVTKVVSPRVLRTFDVGSSSRPAAMQEIIDLAEQDGWVHDPDIISQGWWGRKKARGFDLTIIIRPDAGSQKQINVEVF